MSDKIKVNTGDLNRWATEMTDISRAISSARSMLEAVDTGEEWWSKPGVNRSFRLRDTDQSVSLGSARSAVATMIRTLNRYEQRTEKLGRAIRQASSNFEGAEDEIDRHIAQLLEGSAESLAKPTIQSGLPKDFDFENGPYDNAIIDALGYPRDPSSWTQKMREKYKKFLEDSVSYVTPEGYRVYATDDTVVIVGAGGALYQVAEYSGHALRGEWKTRTYNPDGSYSESVEKGGLGDSNWKTKRDLVDPDSGRPKTKAEEEFDRAFEEAEGKIGKREGTVLEAGYGKSGKVAASHAEGNYEGAYGKGSYSVDQGYAEGDYGLYAGLYVTRTKADGTTVRVLEPGVDAHIGGSFGLAQAEASGRLGNEYAGVGGKVEVAAFEGSAEVGGQAGFVDGELALRASASAEFNVLKAGAEASVDFLGVEGTAGAEFTVGVGAHADVGYSDGTLVVDIGASLGVGGSLYFEVDVGGAIDNTVNCVQNVCESVGDWFDSLW